MRTSVRREVAAYLLLFFYVLWFRVHGLDEGFVLMGDQVRDWSVALKAFRDLPPGVPSLAGGPTLGPNFYWILWGIARVVGPPLDYLPHAGGFGISLLQSQADVLLAWALTRRTGNLALSLAMVLLAATSVPDAIISSSIWNPAVATAIIKVGLVLVLTRAAGSVATTVLITGVAWAAIQTHTTAALAAIPLIAGVVFERLMRSWRLALVHGTIAAGVIVTMQIPWAVYMVSSGGRGPSAVTGSVVSVLKSPLESIRLAASAEAVGQNLASILFFPLSADWLVLLLPAGTLATLALARDWRLVTVGPAPYLFSVLALSIWQGPYERYWMLVAGPSAAIALLAWIASTPERHRVAAGVAALVMVVVLQPSRFERVRTTNTYPGYGALVRGCRAIAADGRPVAAITAEFHVAPGNPLWLCTFVGAGVTAGALEAAVIEEDGAIRFEPAR